VHVDTVLVLGRLVLKTVSEAEHARGLVAGLRIEVNVAAAGEPQLVPCRWCTVHRGEPECVSVVEQQVAELGLTDAHCLGQHGRERRLQLAG
jgi:hypothetical protein